MTALQTCLAALAAAAAKTPGEAKALSIDAIERFAAGGPPEEAPARLQTLADGYDALKLEGAVAVLVRDAIARRIALLEGEGSSPAA
ncbi:hypothetical protein [Hansschlegelia sp. KR7-227]|uniref:hypothetical protein n=1 Tax=Hansschlegelia sp. KR7-227 TaxID=3400914 RepID=UPI003C07A0D2